MVDDEPSMGRTSTAAAVSDVMRTPDQGSPQSLSSTWLQQDHHGFSPDSVLVVILPQFTLIGTENYLLSSFSI